jgi:hypothetical protein
MYVMYVCNVCVYVCMYVCVCMYACMYGCVCIYLFLFMYGLLLAPLLQYNSNTTSILLAKGKYSCYT